MLSKVSDILSRHAGLDTIVISPTHFNAEIFPLVARENFENLESA
jgi:hypothetical protein